MRTVTRDTSCSSFGLAGHSIRSNQVRIPVAPSRDPVDVALLALSVLAEVSGVRDGARP